MNAKIDTGSPCYKSEDMEKAHKAIKAKWGLLRNDLRLGKFRFNDVCEAKKSKFLSEFDSLFTIEGGQVYFTKTLTTIFNDAYVIRGTILRESDTTPTSSRFMPNSVYIKEDNRFSPRGVEWLYLALGFPKDKNGKEKAKLCSEKECRAQKGDRFAFCEFIAADNNVKIVDLTLGEKWNPHRQRHEIRRLIKSSRKKDALLRADVLENDLVCQRNIVAAYANIMSSELFVPLITSDNKSITYAPFHCIAYYFQSLGYGGIIYKSTVYSKGKNLVLFEKKFAIPVEKSIEVRKIEKSS